MKREHGYYIAMVPSCARGDVIAYWNGEDFLTVGNDSKTRPEEFIFIAASPINTGESKVAFIGGENWLNNPVTED